MATRLKDWEVPYTWWVGIEITNNHVINVLLRELNNLIHVNEDRELYVDLQLDDWIEPEDDFPVGVTTGKILQEDWWTQSGIILNWKTTSWDYVRFIYANDWKLYYDPGTWQWIEIWTWWGGGVQINVATASTLWIIKLGSDTQQVEAQVTATSISGRTYPVQLNSSNQAVVNIPWTDTTYTAGTNITIDNNNEISATIPSVLVYKWNVTALTDLPASWTVGDTYFVEWEDAMYSWDWTQWNYVGGTTIDVTNLFNKTIDDSDDIVQGSTHLFVTQAEKDRWNWKQDALTEGNWIDITNNVISNTLPFDPQNAGSLGQFLKKTSTGYQWANVPSSWWGGGSYTAGDWISISNNVISNTAQFDPTNSGTTGQVLKKGSGDTYYWASESWGGEQDVKVWNIPSGWFSQQEMQEIVLWCTDSGNYERSAILKSEQAGNKNLYVYGWKNTVNNVDHYYFYWMWEKQEINTTSQNGDFTTKYNTQYHISFDGTTYTWAREESTEVWGNYLTVESSGYTRPYMPTASYQPATKAYVDAVAAGSVQVQAITNNTTGTNLTLQQEWVWTQAQYEALTPINWVIYNIIPSS